MAIRKAVIPAAGLGTRVLPASKSIPKEMLPIVDKPALQYIVEEAVASGITDILIITGRGKGAMEDHFDKSPELERRLAATGKESALKTLEQISSMANIHYLRQQEPRGLGHAVSLARSFVGAEPFAVLYGDDVIIGERPACGQLCEAFEKHGRGVAGIKPVPAGQIHRYSSLKVEPMEGRCYTITDMIEKPEPGKEFSNYSILGRCVLPASIFEILDETPPGSGGEIQLTDAMRTLALRDGMIGIEYEGTRYDMGNKLGYMMANIEVALHHPEIGTEFREYLRALQATLF